MTFSFEGIVKVTAEHTKGSSTSKHVSTDFYLEVSDNLDDKKYMNKDDVLTAEGSKAVAQCFVQGLIANMHFAHNQGYRNDVEHLRYIISELERGFSSVADTMQGNYTPVK